MTEQPGGLPPELTADPSFVLACNERDLSKVFRLARTRAGFYPSRIARLTGLTVSRVSEIADGKRNPSTIDVLERIADGLRIPGTLLGLACRPWEPAPVPPADHGPETWEILDTLTRGSAADVTLLNLQAAVLSCAARYPSTGPGQLMPQMGRQLSSVHRFLGQPQTLRSRRLCIEMLSVLAGLLGLAHLDLGNLATSEAMFQVGLLAATEAEQEPLTAWLLTMRSISLTTTGETASALELLIQADTLARTGPSRRRAWISANVARAQAAAGDHHAALSALESAAEHLARADPIAGLDFFTTARLDGIHGTTRLLLGDHPGAGALLETALDGRDRADSKGLAMLTFDLAECRIRQLELDEGCRLAHTALDLVADDAVQPALIRAETLRRALDPWKTRAPVITLTERMRESQRMHARA